MIKTLRKIERGQCTTGLWATWNECLLHFVVEHVEDSGSFTYLLRHYRRRVTLNLPYQAEWLVNSLS